MRTSVAEEPSLLKPERWGLPAGAEQELPDGLRGKWEEYRVWFRTSTRDNSEQALLYMQGLLRMPGERNFANIARRINGAHDDGQRLQHFMSNSPWQGFGLFDQIQSDLVARPELAGGMLSLDDSGDEKAGGHSAGAARQYIGRQGKLDMGQVTVAVSYYHRGIWAMLDAELYLPRCWFEEDHAARRRQCGIPEERRFLTKNELGFAMVRRARANGVPFEVVGADSAFGRDSALRAALDGDGLRYMMEVPRDTLVWCEASSLPSGLGEQDGGALEVRKLEAMGCLHFEPVLVRSVERGSLCYDCAALRVRTVAPDGSLRQEWLLVRREHDGKLSFALSNAPSDASLSMLARYRALRYFVERTFQDAKTELGWDELQARKYLAWLHHTALTALSLWFIAETKLNWRARQPQDPVLQQQFGLDALPALSLSNVRELFAAVMPLEQLSAEQARELVAKHLLNRARSTSSRVRKARKAGRRRM